MLTPSEIRDKAIKSGIDYKKKDVEQFINEFSSDYEQLFNENEDLKKKLKDLTDSISYYKSIEKTLQKALIIAEKTAEDTKAAAAKEADAIVTESRAKTKLIQSEAQKKLELLEHKTLNLLQQYDFFKIHFQNLLNSQLELLNSDSFKLNTADFTYNVNIDLQSEADEEPVKISGQPAKEQDSNDHRIYSDNGANNEDGFEFIDIKEE